jgi:hypothetical protein
MNSDMEKIAMEGNAEMLSGMLTLCREKTLKKSHTSDQLSADEKKQFYNCITKFFETPNHIMSALQGMQGGQM